jgi:hypothetical protein
MTSDEFVTWLKGFLQALQSDRPEIKVILDKVAFVAQKEKPVTEVFPAQEFERLKELAKKIDAQIAHVPPYPLKNYVL